MDDQFGGRTDDDLFADEFEPIEEQQSQQEPASIPASTSPPVPAAAPVESHTPVPATAPTTTQAPAAVQETPSALQTSSHAPASEPVTSPSGAPKGIMQSRHAGPEPPTSTPRAPRSHRSNHSSTNNANGGNNRAPSSASPSSSSPAPPTGPKADGAAPHERRHKQPGSDARMSSGANPRQKLTEDELAEKMRKMAILNAERAAKFKQQEQDRESHEVAVAKASEDAKKRRAEEAERRKHEAANRRQMDDERERNRERKLKAMEAKMGGSWDEGKDERELEEERRRGGYNFRGANGGVRGPAPSRGGGLGGSRFATSDDTDFMTSGRGGRGRGRGGRGRGGRGGAAPRDDYFETPPPQQVAPAAAPRKGPSLTAEEFPALPGSAAPKEKKNDVTAKADLGLASPLSPLGRWDEEMETQDAKATTITS